jgi:hypothetical protein
MSYTVVSRSIVLHKVNNSSNNPQRTVRNKVVKPVTLHHPVHHLVKPLMVLHLKVNLELEVVDKLEMPSSY